MFENVNFISLTKREVDFMKNKMAAAFTAFIAVFALGVSAAPAAEITENATEVSVVQEKMSDNDSVLLADSENLIVNGDAETDGTGEFTCSNASVFNETDAQGNRFFHIKPYSTATSNSWVFLRYPMEFEAGATYKYSFRIAASKFYRWNSADKIVENEDTAQSVSEAVFNVVARYSKDTVVGTLNDKLSESDGWYNVEGIFTVADDYTYCVGDSFGIGGGPADGNPLCFMIDDLSLVKVEKLSGLVSDGSSITGFVTDASSIAVTDDPYVLGNKVISVHKNTNYVNTSYPGIRYNFEYTFGATYKYSFDAAFTTDPDGNDVNNACFDISLCYYDSSKQNPTGGKYGHNLGAYTSRKSKSDKWQHYEGTFTVNDSNYLNGGDQFKIYSDKNSGFLLDNLCIEKVDERTATVTYNTNAPAGANVISETPADTDRGVGKGYLLSDTYPEVEGYAFAGWALKSDALPTETVKTIDLTEDTTVYAVWVAAQPENSMMTSIRPASSDKSAGIRFLSSVSASVRNLADEYGYLVARTDKLGDTDLKFGSSAPEYKNDNKNFNGKTDSKVKYTGAVNYSRANGIDILYDADDSNVRFTVVMVGLDGTFKNAGKTYANRYDVYFTARPYVKIGDTYYYGDCKTMSLKEKAEELLKDTSLSEADRAAYEKIVKEAGQELTETEA